MARNARKAPNGRMAQNALVVMVQNAATARRWACCARLARGARLVGEGRFLGWGFSCRCGFVLLALLALLLVSSLAAQSGAAQDPAAQSATQTPAAQPSAAQTPVAQSTTITPEQAAAKVQQAWDTSWSKFFLPQTNLFYDFLESLEPGKELAHLPTPEEVQRQFPNEMGYDTGMEDCMIYAGAWLETLTDRYACTQEESLKELADRVLRGIELCSTVHGSPGFLARGVCPTDQKSTYINSSRDQYTHAVHGLWLLYHSPMSTDEQKARIRVVAGAIADRMIRNVTPENDYDALCSDGSRCRRRIQRMWNVDGHEACRLPMIYAIAWDVYRGIDEAKAATYYREYRRYIAEAVRQSLDLENQQFRFSVASYARLQMQCSLEVLYQLETDAELKEGLRKCMVHCRNHAAGKVAGVLKRGLSLDLNVLPGRDWREPNSALRDLSGYRVVWYTPREMGELIQTILMCPDTQLTEEQRQAYWQLLNRIDYERVSTSGIFYLVGAYWMDQRKTREGK